MLFRWYNQGDAITEAAVNASTTPSTKFATYAQTRTGVAFANPSSTESAFVTILVLDATGNVLNSSSVTLSPEGHQAYDIYKWFNQSFTGSVQIVSTAPIVSPSLNAEASTQADPVVSSVVNLRVTKAFEMLSALRLARRNRERFRPVQIPSFTTRRVPTDQSFWNETE